MLQAQIQSKLKEMAVRVEGEPEGEMIVEPPGKNPLLIQINSFSKSAYYSSGPIGGTYC